MHRFAFTHDLPDAPGVHPAFHDRFSGWQLGMGLPQTLAGLLPGLTKLGESDPACRATATGMALWGFQAHPLAQSMAAWAVSYMDKGLRLSPPLARLALGCAEIPPLEEAEAEAMEAWYALARQEDRSLILRFLAVVMTSPKALSWLSHCWQDMLFLNMPEVTRAALDMVNWNETTLPLKPRLEAEWAFQMLPPEDALPLVEALDAEIWGLWRAYAGAELLLRTNKNGAAKGALATLWKAIPWHVNLTLKLHDLFNAPTIEDKIDADDVAILLYSWNKADLLRDTLNSLAASDIGAAKIHALNNGSTDNTAEVLAEAVGRFGQDRFHVETLPINVGAPAARNWLLALPEVKKAKWAAFLDDDVVLPENWLRQLLGTAKVNPGAGAIGCRITAATQPFGLQSADYNLFPTPPQAPESGKLPNRVQVYDNCAGSLDLGLFSYTRPCLSVSGCCHLIAMDAIEKAGGFDLRYTPSQFDDLDRDLRSALAGMPAVYVGNLAVRHVQHSSLAKSQTTSQIGHVLGNKFKLDTKYSDEELLRLGSENRDTLWADLREKHTFLVDRLRSRP